MKCSSFLLLLLGGFQMLLEQEGFQFENHRNNVSLSFKCYEDNPVISNNLFDSNGNKIDTNLKYKFNLKPIYCCSNVRKDSQAALAGIQKNDRIVNINKRAAYTYSLQEINDILKSEDGTIMVFQFELKSIL